MFERYTEAARRTLFCARDEASTLGSLAIEPEHLLLGVLRTGKGIASDLLAHAAMDLISLRSDIRSRTPARDPVSPPVEIPFTAECRRTLQYAAEEADRLVHAHIGSEHLLLGMLRMQDAAVSRLLVEKGIDLKIARAEVARLTNGR